MEIRDAATLTLLNTLESPWPAFLLLTFSQDCRFLAGLASGHCFNWDLKTGGSVGVGVDSTQLHGLAVRRCFSSVYSIDGKTVAVILLDYRDQPHIVTCDVSAARTHVYPVSEGPVIRPIWTRGEFLRFATVESGRITIWEVDFAFTHPPEAVESLTIPDEITYTEAFHTCLFLPTRSRLAIVFHDTLSIWDARGSKLLLESSFPDLKPWPPYALEMSFSSNGLFFTYLFRKTGEVFVWKESPSGYTLHQRLAFPSSASYPGLFLSPDGASIIISSGSQIHLWHTKDPILSWGLQISAINPCTGYLLSFSPTDTLAAFASELGSTVTILDLQSGDKKMVIDAGMGVRFMRVAESAVVVVDNERIVTWNVVGRNTRADINDSARIATFDPSPHRGWFFTRMSVSPDLSRIVTSGCGSEPQSECMEVYDVSTGRRLTGIGTLVLKSLSTLDGFEVADPSKDQSDVIPWFTPEGRGREIWNLCRNDSVDRWDIIEDDESGTTKLQSLDKIAPPPGVFSWQSSHGYKFMDDHRGWILSPTQKRILWLPHEWRSSCWGNQVWSGRFLGLTHHSEVVILECID